MTSEKKTLRLLMPQWQGGNNPIYYLGAQLLYWLAPKGDADFAEVPVAAPDGSQLPLEGGVLGKSAILKQNEAALESVRRLQAGLHSFLSMRRIEARRKNASAFRLRFSQSLASLRQRLSHAMVRSTIQRLGKTTNPLT